MQLTPAISSYVKEKLVLPIQEILSEPEENVKIYVEVGKSTKHHQKGNVFVAEVNVSFPGGGVRARAETGDLYAAIDLAKDEVFDEITSLRGKQQTLFRRGARLAKDALKGLYALPGATMRGIGHVGRGVGRGLGKITNFRKKK